MGFLDFSTPTLALPSAMAGGSPRRLPPGLRLPQAPMPADLLLGSGDEALPIEDGAEGGLHDTLQLLNHVATLKDGNTAQHVVRMAHISACLGERYGLNARQNDMLLHAAPLHDIGKIAIPDTILKKDGPLSPEEMACMRTHCQIGFDLLSRSQATTLRLGAEIALNHHERWDGGGYPCGRQGEQIPLSARIVAVADVFDALTSVRPYKAAWSFEQSLAHVEAQSGAHFDPAVVACLRPCIGQIRSIVEAFS